MIPASADVGTSSQTSDTRGAALANNIALAAAARAATSGNDTGRSIVTPALAVETSDSADAVPWIALLILGFVAFVVLKK
jgi:hypothetical protein